MKKIKQSNVTEGRGHELDEVPEVGQAFIWS